MNRRRSNQLRRSRRAYEKGTFTSVSHSVAEFRIDPTATSLTTSTFRAPSGAPVLAKGGESIVSFTDLYTYLRARFVREEGQTMAEYGVVLAVIALTVIVAFTALSGGISNAINNVTKVLNG
jgi:pilus assembly protein Flp/PilA